MSDRPNILLAIADDQAWPHTSAYGCQFVDTPAFDRVAREGVLFTNNYCPAPSCSPSRAGLLTGRYPWELEQGVHLWSLLPARFDVYPDILERAGYHVGHTFKGWGPGSIEDSGRTRNPAGPAYNRCQNTPPTTCMSKNDYAANFADFLAQRPAGAPFCFWYGAKEPHRVYEKGSGLRAGKRLDDVDVPPYLPDCEEVRSDLLDYALEIEWFDTHLQRMMERLEQAGELENTIIVVTGDNGLPFPRAKANVYEQGMRVPLAIRWGAQVPGGRTVTDLVSFVDLAPTFLEAVGVEPKQPMTGRSLLSLLRSGAEGRVEPQRDHILCGRERHAYSRPDNLTYPMRCIRTDEWVYIRNYEPDRWPAGDPPVYGDVDGSPTKNYMIAHRQEEGVRELHERAFGRRPAEELYAVQDGYACLQDRAQEPALQETVKALRERLEAELRAQGDPRLHGRAAEVESWPYCHSVAGPDGKPRFVGTDDLQRNGLL